MDTLTDLITYITASAQRFLAQAVEYAPVLLAALSILLLGWLVARLVRSATRHALNSANRLFDRHFQHSTLSRIRFGPAAVVIIGTVAHWLVLVFALTIASGIAGFVSLSLWLNYLITYLPNLLLGAAIIAGGYFISVIISEQLTENASEANLGHASFLGRLAQSGIFLTALIIGLDQIGVNVTFLVALFAVSIGAVFIGFSIAFGLGARAYVSNLISARAAQRTLKPGQIISINDVEGEITEITSTHIELDTARGRVLIPASVAEQHSLLIISPDDSGGLEGRLEGVRDND